VRNNVIRYHESWGAQIYGSVAPLNVSMECKIYNNLIYGNKDGLTVWAGGGFTNYVYGNTICYNTNYGFVPNYGFVDLTNNIILGNPSGDAVQGGDAATTWYCDYNASTASLSPYDGPHDVVTNYMGFVNSTNGLYWLKADSPARNETLAPVCGPVDFFGDAQSRVTDIGAFQYSAAYAEDSRVLDPSTNPDYWAILTLPSTTNFYVSPSGSSTNSGFQRTHRGL
jgi:hypothetical protein